MEQKKSIVKNVIPNGTWEGNYGLMYKFEVEFENGDVGEYLSKSENQDKFIVGRETEYQFKGGQFPRVKPVSNFNASYSSSKSDAKEDIRFSVAFKAAIELCAADKIGLEEIIETTIGFDEFLDKKKDTRLPF
tara:strand:+ start:323 stop:721 length:399 start_codon:yes stop_codon:yes gene_type:complete